MKRSITWRAKGGEVTHTIPEGASVAFNKDVGTVVFEFKEDGEISYLKHSVKSPKSGEFLKGWILFPGEYGDDSELEAFVRVLMGKERMVELVTPILDGMEGEEAVESIMRLIEDLCERYPDVTEVFAERLRSMDMSKGLMQVEICEWCGNAVSDGLTHGEGKCFDTETGESLR